jgi:hypothetical protein
MDLSFAVLLLSANSSNFERLRRSKQQALRNKESMLLVAYRNLSMPPPQQSVSIGIKESKAHSAHEDLSRTGVVFEKARRYRFGGLRWI